MVRERSEGGLENVAEVMRRKGIIPPRNIPKVPEINPSCGFSLDIIQKEERRGEDGSSCDSRKKACSIWYVF